MEAMVARGASGATVGRPPLAALGGQEGPVGWEVTPEPAHDRVTAVFEGYLEAEAGAASAAAFREAFTGTPLEVRWDVTRMTGFDGGARAAWAEVLWPLRKQIKGLKVIGAKGIVRVGATFLAFLLATPCEFVDSNGTESNVSRRLGD